MSSKTFNNTYLYNKFPGYEKELFNMVMNGTPIDPNSEAFADVRYEVKRCPISNSLVKVLTSKNVKLMIGNKVLPKAFKVVAMKDVKTDGKVKVFIDCTDLIVSHDGIFKCKNIDILISYLVNAVTTMVYTVAPKRFTGDSSLLTICTDTYATLFTYIIDYLFKISASNSNTKDKCRYLCGVYFLSNLLEMEEDSNSVQSLARKISGISEREADLIKIKIPEDGFLNIKTFTETISKVCMLEKLTCDLLVEKWMWLYGTGTVFALELFPSFAAMITDAYVGGYINNQKTIEKIADRKMVEMSKKLITIGSASV